jgi:hypothetical protein
MFYLEGEGKGYAATCLKPALNEKSRAVIPSSTHANLLNQRPSLSPPKEKLLFGETEAKRSYFKNSEVRGNILKTMLSSSFLVFLR